MEPHNFYQEQLMEGYDQFADPEMLQKLQDLQANA